LAVYGLAIEVAEPHSVRCEHGQVAIGQEEHVARVVQDGGHVRRHEILVVAQSDHHRRPGTRSYDLVWIGARNHGQREHAGDFLHRRAHGFFQVSVEVLLH
jgi:hypothetical protein